MFAREIDIRVGEVVTRDGFRFADVTPGAWTAATSRDPTGT